MMPCVELCEGNQQTCPELDSTIKEADSRIIPHTEKAVNSSIRRVVVHSNDTDVVVYLLYYVHHYISLGMEELWIKYGLNTALGTKQDTFQFTSYEVSFLAEARIVLSCFDGSILTGCDVTSKVGTKLAALNS